MFAFDLYDFDKNERMDREEAHALLKDIYGRYFEKSSNAKRFDATWIWTFIVYIYHYICNSAIAWGLS